MDLRADDSHRVICPECKMAAGAHLFHCSRVVGTTDSPFPTVPMKYLTEDDVRRIVREELSQADPMVLRK